MMTSDVEQQQQPRHRLELKHRGFLVNIREGPYLTHNVLVTHMEYLKKTNAVDIPSVFRIFPVGGSFRTLTDVLALVTWYFMAVYAIVTIPIACYCQNSDINIINAIILAVLCMYHLVAVYLVFRNKQKVKDVWFTLETTADRYMGLQNYFKDISLETVNDENYLPSKHKQDIFHNLCSQQDRKAVLMLITSSYWKSRIWFPAICLFILAVLCFIGIFIQIETLKFDSNH